MKKGKILGCIVSTKGIEANPHKIEAILRMELPKWRNGAQRLAGRITSLNRFISRSIERSLSFFEVRNQPKYSNGGPPQQKAFEDLKQYLIQLVTLSPSLLGTPLLLYVSTSQYTISVALVQEKLRTDLKNKFQYTSSLKYSIHPKGINQKW